jgi:hypothetical protein
MLATNATSLFASPVTSAAARASMKQRVQIVLGKSVVEAQHPPLAAVVRGERKAVMVGPVPGRPGVRIDGRRLITHAARPAT